MGEIGGLAVRPGMITNAKEARAAIGKRVYWDDVGTRYVVLRSGIVEGYTSRQIIIDGDYKVMRYLKNLRTFEHGGEFAK